MSTSISRDLAQPRTRIWMPDPRPLVPHGSDNEFDTSHADLLETDNATKIVPSIVDGRLQIEMAYDASGRRAFMTKAVPAGSEYAYATKVEVSSGTQSGGSVSAALVIAGDLSGAPLTAPMITLEFIAANGSPAASDGAFMQVVRWTDWDTVDSIISSVVRVARATMYLRIRVNGTTVSYDYSDKGYGWGFLFSHTLPFTAARMGVGGVCETSAFTTAWAWFDFFRVKEGAGTSALNAVTIGREVSLVTG